MQWQKHMRLAVGHWYNLLQMYCFELESRTLETYDDLSLFAFVYFCFLSCSYVQSACKIFKAAEECRLDRDEEKSYVLYMKYLTVYDIIKKRPDFKQHPV